MRAQDDEYDHLPAFSEGDTVWYKSSDGDEVKARVKRAGSDELDLNVREDADPARVRPRDPEGEASDDDEYDHLSESEEEEEEEDEEGDEEEEEEEEEGEDGGD